MMFPFIRFILSFMWMRSVTRAATAFDRGGGGSSCMGGSACRIFYVVCLRSDCGCNDRVSDDVIVLATIVVPWRVSLGCDGYVVHCLVPFGWLGVPL